jgi:hypothetical protein
MNNEVNIPEVKCICGHRRRNHAVFFVVGCELCECESMTSWTPKAGWVNDDGSEVTV